MPLAGQVVKTYVAMFQNKSFNHLKVRALVFKCPISINILFSSIEQEQILF